MRIFRVIISVLLAVGITASSCGCSGINGITGGETLRILSGSENEELEQILQACEKSTGVNIEITYKGSVDIMRELKDGVPDYDAVWTASSLWLSLGDEKHIVKHDESTVTEDTPVETASKMTMARCQPYIYDLLPVIDGQTRRFDLMRIYFFNCRLTRQR